MDTAPDALFHRVERFYDAASRDRGHQEDFGSLVLFRSAGAGWPRHARPRLGAAAPPSAAEIAEVRRRQRELGLPEAFEWIHETVPQLLPVARSAGLTVREAPLMALDPAALPRPPRLPGVTVWLLDPAAADFGTDLADRRAVTEIALDFPGSARGPAGPAERDAVWRPLHAAEVAEERERAEGGLRRWALAVSAEEGALAGGAAMRSAGTAELTGLATLPSARRRGLGTAVLVTLARALLADGVDLVLLCAADTESAPRYLRTGFRRVGTACVAEPAPVRVD